ncbi:hypothetical protein CPC08DRAFT_710721 [Agrocybe pediades]|nr:hypothetical protein CPC08DRAFT_710721 [Agrocybe pediades]
MDVDHRNAGNVYGHHNTQHNYTTTSSTASSMISGNNILITGRPKFTTVNGKYTVLENKTQTTNVNSNNVIGNTLTETLYDNSQVIYIEGRGRTQQVTREPRYQQDETTGNGGHQANAFPPPTSFPTQFPPSHFPGLPNSTTRSSGYTQTFSPALAAPFPSFTNNEGGIVSTSSFNIDSGDVSGMTGKTFQAFSHLFLTLQEEHPVQFESSRATDPTVSPAIYDNSTQPPSFIGSASGSSYSSPPGDQPPQSPSIVDGMANLSVNEPEHTYYAAPPALPGGGMPTMLQGTMQSFTSPLSGQQAQPNYQTSSIVAGVAGLFLNEPVHPVQTNDSTTPIVAGIASLSLNQPVQSNYALPVDGTSTILKSTILSAASMPDNNVQTSSGRPRVDTSSSTHLYGPPAASFTSTLFDSPVSQTLSTHSFQPDQRQTATTPYRQSTVSDFGGVQIAPGAHVTSMTFNGSYTEVNHQQTTVNHGMSGMVVGNTVTHVQNVVSKESMMQPGEVKEGTRKHSMGKQGHTT